MGVGKEFVKYDHEYTMSHSGLYGEKREYYYFMQVERVRPCIPLRAHFHFHFHRIWYWYRAILVDSLSCHSCVGCGRHYYTNSLQGKELMLLHLK